MPVTDMMLQPRLAVDSLNATSKLEQARCHLLTGLSTTLTELTASLMNAIIESLSPKVALRVRAGIFKNKLLAIVCVPGSLVGKDAMNFALVQLRFCAKCIRPASHSKCQNGILTWYHRGCAPTLHGHQQTGYSLAWSRDCQHSCHVIPCGTMIDCPALTIPVISLPPFSSTTPYRTRPAATLSSMEVQRRMKIDPWADTIGEVQQLKYAQARQTANTWLPNTWVSTYNLFTADSY